MKTAKIVIIIFGIGLSSAGWVIGQSTHQGSERGIIQTQPPERERELSSLRSEVEKLREEVILLNDQLRNLQARPPVTFFKVPPEVSLCGERVPVEDRRVWEHLDREFLLALNSEAQVILWMKRARRYFPTIERRLKEMGLPDDLKYVTITESSLRPSAVSSSGAAGIWQFIPSTGEKYGMRKNKGLDERFDFLKATEGALAYLKCLFEEFNSWALAMAAYNAGENRVRKEIELQKMANYYYLYLPAETERYVYKIAVAKIILSNPERYGFSLEEREFYHPLQLERIQIELKQPVSLVEVARAIGSYYKEMKEMNPHLSEENIPPGVHFLNLPTGTSERFWAFYAAWRKGLEAR
ncbi:MAG TPA: lytic transglycosylase domain-containing protein [Thermodesulfobacteriota bacterium]|nr:lytic transglycosylase domain-containing protein [Thermodesulfobacteriota bacterium]